MIRKLPADRDSILQVLNERLANIDLANVAESALGPITVRGKYGSMKAIRLKLMVFVLARKLFVSSRQRALVCWYRSLQVKSTLQR